VTFGQFLLDRTLAFEQPVQGGIQVVLISVGDVEVLGQRGVLPAARRGQLGARVQDSR